MNEYCKETGKVTFKTAQEAYKRGEKMTKHRGGNARAYRCQWCGGFHLTSMWDKYSKPRGLHKKGK